MKTEHMIIAAVVVIGVLFSVNSLLGTMTSTSETTTSVASTSSSTSMATSSPTTTTTSTTPRTTSTQATTTTSSTSSTSSTIPSAADPKATVEITADQSVYYSNQLMTFTVSVNSSEELAYAEVSMRGIMAGYYRIDEDNVVNISRGVNKLSFQYRAPKCYGCSGILPGKYNVSAELVYNGTSIQKDTVRVEMKQA